MSNNEKQGGLHKSVINWYPGHMAKTKRQIGEIIHLIDIVLEVIDARIPKSSKIIDMEEFTKNKPRILIMTKYDLCDKIETKKWVMYYEQLGYKVIPIDLLKDSLTVIYEAIDEIMKEIYIKRENKGMLKRRARILVVGIPNVGKSTLINKLVGKKATNTGNKPGITKSLNWIRINQELELLDTPGILWPKFDKETSYNLAVLTAIKEEILPIDTVCVYLLETLNKYYPYLLKERYGIEQFDEDICVVLEQIGSKRGCISRGGFVDYDKVYALLLKEVKDGVIRNITFDRL
jgi:ribosome biogenesis GTPase A